MVCGFSQRIPIAFQRRTTAFKRIFLVLRSYVYDPMVFLAMKNEDVTVKVAITHDLIHENVFDLERTIR